MKKHFLIGVSLLALGITTTAIYAQVTGTSVVDKMKAVAHSFTLAATLNPSDSWLTSDPVKGKKTGDILTAGEWNRVLEIIANAGGGISDVEVVSSQDVWAAAGTSYANRWSEANCPVWKQLISGGCSYPNTRNSFIHNAPKSDLSGWTCWGIAYNGDISSTSAEYPTRPTAYAVCGTYGSGGSGGGSLQISFQKDYSKDGNSSVPTTENIGAHDFCALTRYGEGQQSDSTAGYCKVEKWTNGIWTVSIQALNNNINCQVTCFTGGVSATGGSGWVDVLLTDTADYDTNCEYRFQMNKAMLDGVWSFGSPTPAGNHYYYATYVANNIITASGTYNVMHGIPKETKNKMFLYWVNGTGVDSSANYSITKIQKRCN